VRSLTEAIAIDRKAKVVRLRNLATGDESDEAYDKLLLDTPFSCRFSATSIPIKPPPMTTARRAECSLRCAIIRSRSGILRRPYILAESMRSGRRLQADIIILSIGVHPETTLARAAAFELGSTRGIKVNTYLQTSDPDIYAVGDAVSVLKSNFILTCFAPW
jgi:NADPH-dependent 2,4-dienoyl-CoA reductase/sulfur reductase-like enzyme